MTVENKVLSGHLQTPNYSIMLRDEQNLESQRHVHFANGFPPKGILSSAPRIVPNSNGASMHGGYFVGLQDKVNGPPPLSPWQHKNIPPLAKRRGQFCAIRKKIQDDMQPKTNPFKTKTGMEKVGFSPQPVKSARMKHSRSAHQMGSKVSPNPPPVLKKVCVYRKKPLHIASIYPGFAKDISLTEKPDCDSTASVPVNYIKILSDVEKPTTQEELSGIGEVYKKICQGNMETLSTLVCKTKTQAKKKPGSGLQFIQTTIPLSLKNQLSTKKQNRRGEAAVMMSKSFGDGRGEVDQALDEDIDKRIIESIQRKYRSILLPLPYFKSRSKGLVSTMTSRQTKAAYEPPIIYSNKKQNNKAICSNIHSPSVVNISTASLPQGRPGTRNGSCSPTGEIVGVQSKFSTGTVAIVAAVPHMRISSPNTRQTSAFTPDSDSVSNFFGKQKSQEFDTDTRDENENNESGKMEVESVGDAGSERSCSSKSHGSASSGEDRTTKDMENQQHEETLSDSHFHPQENEAKNSNEIEIQINNVEPGEEDEGNAGSLTVTDKLRRKSLEIVLNVTTEDGKEEEVMMYDSMALEREKKEVESAVQAVAQAKERRKKEMEDLLNEVSEIEKHIEESKFS